MIPTGIVIGKNGSPMTKTKSARNTSQTKLQSMLQPSFHFRIRANSIIRRSLPDVNGVNDNYLSGNDMSIPASFLWRNINNSRLRSWPTKGLPYGDMARGQGITREIRIIFHGLGPNPRRADLWSADFYPRFLKLLTLLLRCWLAQRIAKLGPVPGHSRATSIAFTLT